MINFDKFIVSFITEMKECSQMRNFSIPRCIKKALDDQGLEYKGGEIVKSQRRVSAETKETIYGESEDEEIVKLADEYYDKVLIKECGMEENEAHHCRISYIHGAKAMLAWLEKQGQKPAEWSEEDEKNLRRAIRTTKVVYPETADWLKSIRNRITLKPSIEQMKILEKVTGVDIEKTLNGFQNFYAHENSGEFPSAIEIAKHFYKLGLKASDTELENLLWTLPESIADERSHQVYLMSLYHCDGQCFVDYVGELEEDSLVCFEGETFTEAATKMREWIRKRPKLRKI